MIRKYYKDCYGCTASIKESNKGFTLSVSNGFKVFHKKTYGTFKGARIAMGKLSDYWKENN